MALTLIMFVWIICGYFYLDSGSYERHGIFSLLIIAPYLIVGALWAIITIPFSNNKE